MSERAWKRMSPDAGYELCPSCRGRGWCKWCEGSGRPLAPASKNCDGCAGKGECVLCDGSGQLVMGHYALGEWNNKKGVPSHPVQSVEDQALSEKMRANHMKHMERSARQGASPRLPSDSPIFKKWQADPFPGGPERDDRDPPPIDPKDKERRDVEAFLGMLADGAPRARALALTAIGGRPRADERLLAACERLLADRTITLLSIPYVFGEVRWLAAEAVAALRGLMGGSEPVVIEDAFAPVPSGGVDKLAIDAGITPSSKGGVEGDIETLERVAAAGKLPRRRVTLLPFVPPTE